MKRYRTSAKRRTASMLRRDLLRDLALCINGAAHGPATHGCRCERCHETHRRSR